MSRPLVSMPVLNGNRCRSHWRSPDRAEFVRACPRPLSPEPGRSAYMSDPGTRWEYGTNMDFVGKAVETASGSKRKMASEELENMRGPDGLQMAQQQDGGLPTTVVAGSAAGGSGGAGFWGRGPRGRSFHAGSGSHPILVQTSSHGRFECRMAGQAISHMRPEGTLAITPAGSDCSGDAVGNTELILVAIDPGQLALAAAEDSTPGAQLDGRLSGYDRVLFGLARTLALESAGEYSNGPLLWNEVASRFIDGLVAPPRSPLQR